jgi:hypothetical protein
MHRQIISRVLITVATLVIFSGSVLANQEPRQLGRSTDKIERQLHRLQGRLADSSGALLPRYRQSLTRLESSLNSDDCRRFNVFVQKEIVGLWARIDQEWLLQLSSTPPQSLNSLQINRIRNNDLMVRKLYANLRRVRRLQTRLDKLSQDTGRQSIEVKQGLRQYRRLVDELERKDPRRAEIWRDWLERSVLPPLQGLDNRSQVAGEKVEHLHNWTESGKIRDSLGTLRRVSQAIDSLKRRYSMSRLSTDK